MSLPELQTGRQAPSSVIVWILVSLVAASCNSSTEPKLTESFAVAPSRQWSGGEIVIDIQPRLDSATVEAVLAGDDSLDFKFDSLGRIISALPADMNGHQDITVRTISRAIQVGLVDVFGFERSQLRTPRLVRGLREWVPSFGAAVIGPTGSGLAILYLSTNSSAAFDSIHFSNALYSPGQSADPYEVYARFSSRDSITEWRLTTAVPPTPIGTFYAPSWAYWSIARLRPDIWLWGSHHQLSAVRGPAADGSFSTIVTIQAEETNEFKFLPDLDRVALSGTLYSGGIPVFDMGTGQIAYLIEELSQSWALAAVPSLGEFIAAGRATGTWDDAPYRMSVVDGLSGATKLSRAIEARAVDIEFDTQRGLIYVAGFPEGYVDIYERETLDHVGRMEGTPVRVWDTELALDDEYLYAVFSGGSAAGTIVHSFRLLPIE